MKYLLALVLACFLLSCQALKDELAIDRLVYEYADKGHDELEKRALAAKTECRETAEALQAELKENEYNEPDDKQKMFSVEDFEFSFEGHPSPRSAELKEDLARQAKRSKILSGASSRLRLLAEDGNLSFDRDVFFSIEQLVAADGSFNTTAIPCIGLNSRPFGKLSKNLAIQAVLGGALNPGAGTDTVGAAFGAGFSYPVTQGGSISVGYIYWDANGETQSGVYFGVVLGSFGKKVQL